MIKLLLISLLIIFSNDSWSRVIGELTFEVPSVTQGELVNAKLIMGADDVQKIESQKLKGLTLAETIYIYDISPFMKTGEIFEADIRIIFAKTPSDQSVLHNLPEEELLLNFPSVSVIATDSPPSFIYGDFSIPERPKVIMWSIILLLIILAAIVGRKLFFKYQEKKRLKAKRKALKNELLNAKDYEEIVGLWLKRTSYLEAFPEVDPAFRQLESVLYKCQFKATQTDEEKSQVLEAYQRFCTEVSGGLSGI